jgi:hypothetical protein
VPDENKPRRPDSGPLPPLQPRMREPTGSFVPWKVTAPQNGESVRWQCVDGRWVSIGLGHDEHAGQAVVRTSRGDVHYADSYEGALELAKSLRTV